jgi:hypothetical protein
MYLQCFSKFWNLNQIGNTNYTRTSLHPVADWWALGHVICHGGVDCGQNCQRGNGHGGRQSVVMVAGARAFPRGCAGTRWNQQTEAKLVVAAPSPNGRRSSSGEREQRRRTVADGASESRCELGCNMGLSRSACSPRCSRKA